MRRLASVAVLVLVLAGTSSAREVDQLSDRLFQLQLADGSAVIDARVNAMLDEVATELTRAPQDLDRIIYDTFQGGAFELIAQLHTPFESWVRDDAEVELFQVAHKGIYGGVDYDDVGLGWYVELAPVMRLGPILTGIDKLGHFFGQGWFYDREARAIRANEPTATDTDIDTRVRAYGHALEVGGLGLAGTGMYSYADLAANWSGFVFYRSLFGGTHPYLKKTGDTYRRVRDFHILDYASDAWDEASNPPRPRSGRLFERVARVVRARACADYHRDPVRFLNASGHTQDPRDYVWEGATESTFGCKHRLSVDEMCR